MRARFFAAVCSRYTPCYLSKHAYRRGVRISRFGAYITYFLMHEYATYKVITFLILSIHILYARM